MSFVPPPPWHYWLAQRMIRAGVRGTGWWLRLASRIGWLPELARLPVDDSFAVDLPLRRREYWWDDQVLRGYESALLDEVAERVASFDRPLTLIDCGADIGLFGALLAWRGVRFDRIVAVEPNSASWPALESNLARLDCAYDIHRGGVSDTDGRGRLVQPDYDPFTQARHFEPDAAGDVEVCTIDSLQVPVEGSLLLKLDIEGGELAALRGAAETLRRAPHWLISLEAHPLVCGRTGIDPIECVRFLQSLGDCQIKLAERPEWKFDLERPLFDQVSDLGIGNLLIESDR